MKLSSRHVIDPAFYKMQDGKWHIWYKDGDYPYSEKRSSIQVAELIYKEGTLTTLRDEPFNFWLP